MIRIHIAVAASLALAFSACSQHSSFATDATLDVADADGSSDAMPSDVRDCSGDAGCACIPFAQRCDPDHAGIVQTCPPDGSGWLMLRSCDASQVCSASACVSPCEQTGTSHSYLGCDFWAATLSNPWLTPLQSFPFAVVVANTNDYFVSVRIDGGALTMPVTQTVRPGAVATLVLPWVDGLVSPEQGSGFVSHAAYHVSSNGPIIAYQFNPLTFESTGGDDSFTNDASLLLPTGSLTEHYTHVGYAGGQIAIIGTSSTPTAVTVHATDAIVAGDGVDAGAAGDTRVIVLQQGDVVQLGSASLNGDPNSGDLSGTTITATAPIAVFSAHPCTNLIPQSAYMDGTQFDLWTCDHLEDQLLPNETWGRRYAVSAFIDRPGLVSHIRVIALHDGTHLTFDPPQDASVPTTLDARHVLDFETASDVVVDADGPILVAQFMISAHGYVAPADLGDPSLVFESPVEQYRADSIVLTPSTYTSNFLAITGPADQPPELDGALVTTPPRAIGASGLAVWALPARPGTHRIRSRTPGTTYGVKVYGIAPYTSYAYPGGLDLDPIAPPG